MLRKEAEETILFLRVLQEKMLLNDDDLSHAVIASCIIIIRREIQKMIESDPDSKG